MHWFYKFILSWSSTCFGQFVCPSSGVYSLYTQQWYMSYRFVDSFQAVPFWSCSKAIYKPLWHIPLLSLQWINSWWWTDEISEIRRASWQNKFVKLVHLVGFITNKFRVHHVAPSSGCIKVREVETLLRMCAGAVGSGWPDDGNDVLLMETCVC